MKQITFVLSLFIFLGVSFSHASAATYTVCASGCTSTTIQAVFAGNDLAPGDIVEVQADTPGGSKTYREAVTFGADDGGVSGNPVIFKARTGDTITISGDTNSDDVADLTSNVTITSVDYVEVQNFTLTRNTRDGIIIDGTSTGVVVRDVTSTYSGNQAFQMEGTASATFYNIVGNYATDDGFSMHDNTTAVIHTGSFSNNTDGVNFVGGVTLTANDISITNTSTEVIYATGVTTGITANFTNVTIDQTGSPFTHPVISLIGANVSGNFTNLTISNVPVGTSLEVISVSTSAVGTFTNLTLNGNALDDPVAIRAVGAGLLTVTNSVIDNYAVGISLTSGTAAVSGTQFKNISGRGIYANSGTFGITTSTSSGGVTIENNEFIDHANTAIRVVSGGNISIIGNLFKNVAFHNIEVRPATIPNIQIRNNIFLRLATSTYGARCLLGSVCTIANNTFYDSDNLGSAIFLDAAVSTIKNNIIIGLLNGINTSANVTTMTASHNLFHNTTNNFSGSGGSQTNAITGDPLFTNGSAGFTLPSDLTIQSGSPARDSGDDLSATFTTSLSPLSTWPTGVVSATQSSHGSGWDVGAFVYTIPFAPTAGTITPSITSIAYAFTDNTADETGFKLYETPSTLITTLATPNASSISETGLTANTQYTGRYVVSYSGNGNSTASSTYASTYTLAPTPTNMNLVESPTGTMTVYIDTLTNENSGSSGYYFARTGGGNSGWIQTASWQDTGLACATGYTYTVKYRNGDAVETSTITDSLTTGACPVVVSPASSGSVPISFLMNTAPQQYIEQLPITQPAPAEPVFKKDLYRGLRNGDVRLLQTYLSTQKELYPEGLITGYYGVLTQNAVKRFQEQYKIAKKGDRGHGRVGPMTRGQLNLLVK